MTASYPSTVFTKTTHNNGDTVQANDVNSPEDELVAVETGLLSGLQHTLRPLTDVTYDLGTSSFRFRSVYTSALQALDVASRADYVTVTAAAASGTPAIAVAGTDAIIPLSIATKSTGTLSLLAGATTLATFVPVASAVNYPEFDSAATGNATQIFARGTDATVSLLLNSKSTGLVGLRPGGLGVGLDVAGTVSAVDGLVVTPAVTGSPGVVVLAATGSDTNITINLQSKGTGTIQTNGQTIGIVPTPVTSIPFR